MIRLFSAVLLISLVACQGPPEGVPKPRAFPKVEYPERQMTTFSSEECPFTFNHPDYFSVEMKTSFFGEQPVHPCWFDLYSKELNARIHCSYYEVSNQDPFDKLVRDAFTMANKINQRSNYMDEIRVANENGVSGLVMEFTGPAASPMHFFLSDTTTHFLKASLYFNTQARPDSLAPVTEFIKTDIAGIINSFSWR